MDNTIYTDIYRAEYSSLRHKLKPILCSECRTDYNYYGKCEKCLKNQAYNMEYLQTHTFITDDDLESYHSHNHDNIKACPLRLPNEHPRLFYGIELEVEFEQEVYNYDDYDERNESTCELDEILREFTKITDGLFVYEEDGSLDNGVELISRPCSYAYWTSKDTVKKLKEGLEYLQEQGAMIDQPSTNGMHIHISKKFFQNREGVDEYGAYREFDWLFQVFQSEIEKLGGRKYTSYCASKVMKLKERYTSRYMDVDGASVDVKLKAKIKKDGGIGNDHYTAVISSGPTIEARVFKSTVDYKHVLANIELVRNFAHASRENSTDKTLDELLHTKDNLYLDEHIQKVRMRSKKNGEMLDLTKKSEDEINVEEGE